MADRYLLESGSPDGYQLEDGSGVFLLDVPAVTWNPSDKYTNVTLSNGNKTATGLNGVGAAQCCRGTTAKTTGKWYYEVRCDTLVLHLPIGFDNGTTGVASFTTPGQSDSKGITYRDDGVIFFGANGGSPSSASSFTSGDVIGVAVDASTGQVWFAKNNTWTSGDPATATGGYASGISTFYPYVGPFHNDAGTGRWATADLSYSVPSGFASFDSDPAAGSAVGSSTGAATVSGVGAAQDKGVGSATGAATPAGIGAANDNGVGSSAGVATPSGVGKANAAGSGSASGTATLGGAATSLAGGSGSSAGIASTAGAAAASNSGSGTAAGGATAGGTGAALALGNGQGDGTASITGQGLTGIGTQGAADGSSQAAGIGAARALASGSSAGSADAEGEGAAAQPGEAVGVSDGSSASAGVGAAQDFAAGAAAGSSTADAVGLLGQTVVGSSLCVSIVTGLGAAFAAGDGAANGTSETAGVGRSITPLQTPHERTVAGRLDEREVVGASERRTVTVTYPVRRASGTIEDRTVAPALQPRRASG